MKFMTLKNKVHKIQKGAYTSVLWEREAKVKKGCMDVVRKRTRATVRLGLDYENLSVVKEGRQKGTMNATPSPLAWGQWDEFPYFIRHKNKSGTETKYLRMYLGKGANITTEWFLNGHKVSKDVVRPLLLASELKDEAIECEKPVVVKVSDILSIG